VAAPLVREVSGASLTIESILQGGEYTTKTRGTRQLPPAAPVGEGRYAIVRYGNVSQLVFRLRRPKHGQLADRLGLSQEASYVIAVRNPKISVEGFPDAEPDYPESVSNLFKGRRWLPVSNSGLLNYPNAQLVLISAFDEKAAEKLGVDFERSPDIDDLVSLDLPEEGLIESRFPKLADFAMQEPSPIKTGLGAGGEKGGRTASEASDSASAVAQLLAGIELPATKKKVLDHARSKQNKLKEAGPALERLEQLPRETFSTMPELQEALARETGQDRYICETDGRVFETRSAYRRHLQTSHPESAVSAADLEHAVVGVDYPADRRSLKQQAKQNEADEKTLDVIDTLPDREFRDAADLATAFQASVTGEGRRPQQAPSTKALQSTSAAALAKLLEGIDLPARAPEIRKHAEKNGADRSMLAWIESMPDRNYKDLAEVEVGFSEAKRKL